MGRINVSKKELKIPTKKIGNLYVGIFFWRDDTRDFYSVHVVIHKSRRVVNDALLCKRSRDLDSYITGNGDIRPLLYAKNQIIAFSKTHSLYVATTDFEKWRIYEKFFSDRLHWKSVFLEEYSYPVFANLGI